jgi:hypothetical protein
MPLNYQCMLANGGLLALLTAPRLADRDRCPPFRSAFRRGPRCPFRDSQRNLISAACSSPTPFAMRRRDPIPRRVRICWTSTIILPAGCHCWLVQKCGCRSILCHVMRWITRNDPSCRRQASTHGSESKTVKIKRCSSIRSCQSSSAQGQCQPPSAAYVPSSRYTG